MKTDIIKETIIDKLNQWALTAIENTASLPENEKWQDPMYWYSKGRIEEIIDLLHILEQHDLATQILEDYLKALRTDE